MMRSLMTLTVVVCLLFYSVPAMADQAEDEAAIRKAEEKFIAALNAHDARAMVATAVEDAQSWDGARKGAAARQKYIEELFAGPYKNVRCRLLDEIGIVFVTPDVAIFKARYENSGLVDDSGGTLPPVKFLNARIYVKKNGEWLGAHGTLSRTIEE